MPLDLKSEPLPLRWDDDGETIRVGHTRITLDVLLCALNQGQPPEAIVADFDALALADVYTVAGYYLRHRAEIDAYLEQRQREANRFREEMEARFPAAGLRERLLARCAAAKIIP